MGAKELPAPPSELVLKRLSKNWTSSSSFMALTNDSSFARAKLW